MVDSGARSVATYSAKNGSRPASSVKRSHARLKQRRAVGTEDTDRGCHVGDAHAFDEAQHERDTVPRLDAVEDLVEARQRLARVHVLW